MSTTDPKPPPPPPPPPSQPQQQHPRKQKQKEPKSQPVAPNGGGTERLKTVVRRLPPNLPEDIFWQSVQAWVTDDTVTWKSYHPGKMRVKRVNNKEGIPSRAYIAFKNEAQVATFSRAYDGHVFRDKAGNESHAVVEYAPFQKVPTEKKKVDARNNTIDKDDDYLSFLETLKDASKTESVSLDALIAASQPLPPPTTTPLLEALKAEKSAQKDKEAILRNHAHYKEVIMNAASSKKEEAKKKAAANATAAAAHVVKQPEQHVQPTMTKRAKKAAAGAAQKTSMQNAQGSQGKNPSVGAATSAQATTPSTGRHRPKETHGRLHPSKGETASSSGPSSLPVTTADNVPSTTPATPVPAPAQQRKHRPVIGLGRGLEAALSGAGVVVSPSPAAGERKRRDKGGDGARATSGTGTGAGAGAGPAASEGNAGKTRPHREERQRPSEVVPSILQRPEGGGSDVVSVQRPQSPRGTEGHGDGAGASGSGGKGSTRRGKGRRGRVG